jgi:hypothetical protein
MLLWFMVVDSCDRDFPERLLRHTARKQAQTVVFAIGAASNTNTFDYRQLLA